MQNNLKDFWHTYRWDIRLWLVFFFLIRLVGITNPPLEMSHNWRQSLTAMIALNFYDLGPNLLYPRIDIGGIREGIIGSEFPLFNYLIYLVSEAFGYKHWYGRLINLTVSTVGVFYFYKGLIRLVKKDMAFYATIILAVSVWFGFSRKIMPDTFSVSLGIIGLYFGLVYLQEKRLGSLLWFFLWSTLGMLCKIPTLSLFAVLAVSVFSNQFSWKYKLLLYATFIGIMFLVWLWYFYWVPYLVETYYYQLFFPKNLIAGWQEIRTVLPELFEKFYFVALSSFFGFICFILGIVYLGRSVEKERLLILGLGSVTLIFGVFVLKTGSVFPSHSYYIIPFVPVMAIVAGYFLGNIKSKYAIGLSVLISIEAIANQQDDLFLKESEMYKLRLTEIAKEYIPTDSLVVLNATASPQQIYFANRNGWSEDSETLLQEGYIDSLNEIGASYLIWDKKYSPFPNKGTVLFKDENYTVSKLD